jgi:hypothetical protein
MGAEAAMHRICWLIRWITDEIVGLSIWLLASLLIASVATAIAEAQRTSQELSPTEKWVLEQMTAGEGEEIDLSKQFPEEKNRTLSARFLEDLVTGRLTTIKLRHNSVRIREAIIDQPVNLRNAQTPFELWLHHCHFKSNVDCQHATFASALLFDDSTFDAAANFNGMKTGGSVFLNNAVFEGPVDFILADIGGNFHAIGAKFLNQKEEVKFGAMKVRAYGFFNNAVFNGRANFRYAEFAGLVLSNVSWPKIAGQIQFQGITYKFIRAVDGNEPQSHKALIKLANQSTETGDVYSNLEQFFLRQGYHEDADRAFIAGKRRERKESLHGLGWFASWSLDCLVGYGRHPAYAAGYCVIIIVIGCVLFSGKKMELQEKQKEGDPVRVYNRFWYSLSLFLPLVDLQAHTVWKPKNSHWILRNYTRVHTLLGWILIPFVLAALTGLIK